MSQAPDKQKVSETRSNLVRFFYTRMFKDLVRLRYRRYFDQPQVFCLFIGYPRSGHTLIGSLLNAHPEMCIAHELNILKYVARGHSRDRLYAKLIGRDKWFSARRNIWTGFSYKVPGQWQGTFRNLKVIGDKKGGRSSRALTENPELLDRLQETLGIPVRLIHIVRNPFDNIATRARGGSDKNKEATPEDLKREIDRHFREVETISRIRQEGRYEMYEARHEDFLEEPARHLAEMCRFLGVEASDDYLEACTGIIRRSRHKSRHKVEWTQQAIDDIRRRMEPYDFLRHYTFDE